MKQIERQEVTWVFHGVAYELEQLVLAEIILDEYQDVFGITAHVGDVVVQFDGVIFLIGLRAGPGIELIAFGATDAGTRTDDNNCDPLGVDIKRRLRAS